MELLGNIKCDYTVNVLRWGYLNKKFSENFILGVQCDIGNLLKEKIKKYGNGSSTSVTVEVGEQLLEAIYYTIDANFISGFCIEEAMDLFKKNSIKELYEKGQEKLNDVFNETRNLYKRVCENKYDTELIAYNDTLIEEFAKFFDVYDMEFHPQNADISVDYPLIFGDIEQKGVLYIKKYLEIIDIENRFCNIFDNGDIETLLDINAKRYKSNYRDLLTNIFEIVINNVILSIIIDGDFEDFYIYSEEINYLKNNLKLENIDQKIDEAVEKMINSLKIEDKSILGYINAYNYRFKEQMKATLTENSLESIAVICDGYLDDIDFSKNKFIIIENRLEDEEFRKILDEIQQESNINKKIEIIKNKINSFEDFDDILRADCFYDDEYEILFDSLSEIELAMLGRIVFYEDIEMGEFNLLNEVFKNNNNYYAWQVNYIEYIKNQTIDRISKIQKKMNEFKDREIDDMDFDKISKEFWKTLVSNKNDFLKKNNNK